MRRAACAVYSPAQRHPAHRRGAPQRKMRSFDSSGRRVAGACHAWRRCLAFVVTAQRPVPRAGRVGSQANRSHTRPCAWGSLSGMGVRSAEPASRPPRPCRSHDGAKEARTHTDGGTLAWRMLLPLTMNTTISAMFVAWSAIRSRYFGDEEEPHRPGNRLRVFDHVRQQLAEELAVQLVDLVVAAADRERQLGVLADEGIEALAQHGERDVRHARDVDVGLERAARHRARARARRC